MLTVLVPLEAGWLGFFHCATASDRMSEVNLKSKGKDPFFGVVEDGEALWVISKETVGSSWDILNAILGHKYP